MTKLAAKYPDRVNSMTAAFDAWAKRANVEADRTEMTNLAAKYPDGVKSMVAAFDAWAKRANVEPFDQVKQKRRQPARS